MWDTLEKNIPKLQEKCEKMLDEDLSLKDYIEERAIDIANYIIKNNAAVRQTARQFGISKSTVR